MNDTELDFYNWEKTLSYDADVTMVVGARGIGKTYGLRKQCVRDWLKDGSRFVEIVRFKNELFDVSDGYFDKLIENNEFPDYVFKTTNRYMYIAEKPENDDDKPKWQLLGYFVALTEEQRKKKKTYVKVRRIIFDEAILKVTDRFHTYLPNESGTLADIVDSLSRERKNAKGTRPRVYLLSNACDLSNPYFIHYGVKADLEYGYRWYKDKTFLLHYIDDPEYSMGKLEGTVAGRMMKGTNTGEVSVFNRFIGENTEFVQRKTRKAKFSFGVVFNNEKFGVWVDMQEGLYFVSRKMPKDADTDSFRKPIFALTASDNRVNYIAARRANKILSYFADMYYLNLVRYETVQVKTEFKKVLALFGIH